MRGFGASLLALLCAAGFAAAQGATTGETDAAHPETIAPPALEQASDAGGREALAEDDAAKAPGASMVQGMVVQSPEGAARVPIMTIDLEDLFLNSAWGRRAQADLEARGRTLADENERLATLLSTEERDLTELRKTLPADQFRTRAEEFDKRVVEVRRERENELRELQHSAEATREAFFKATQPLLAQLMQERGAVAVLDQRMVLVSIDAIDVTADLIKRVDEVAGAGPDDLDGIPAVPAVPRAPAEPQVPGAPAAPSAGETQSPAAQ